MFELLKHIFVTNDILKYYTNAELTHQSIIIIIITVFKKLLINNFLGKKKEKYSFIFSTTLIDFLTHQTVE